MLVFENISLKAPPPSVLHKCLPGRSARSAPGPVAEASEGERGVEMEEGRAARGYGDDVIGGMARTCDAHVCAPAPPPPLSCAHRGG